MIVPAITLAIFLAIMLRAASWLGTNPMIDGMARVVGTLSIFGAALSLAILVG